MGAPVEYANPAPMALSLAQGTQFAGFHKDQHGGNAPYPGGVVSSMLSPDLVASSRTGSTLQALQSVQGLRDPSPSNPMGGGRRKKRGSRKSRKNRGSRKSRKNRANRKNRGKTSRKNNRKNYSRKQRGGLVRWGGSRGGSSQGSLDGAMSVGESGQMLIGPEAQQGAGLNPEWKLAENPMAFAPRS